MRKKLYIMQSGEYIKIGVSDSPESRVKMLQTGNPIEIKLILSIAIDDAYGYESRAHTEFCNKRACGEWFIIDDETRAFVKMLKTIEYKQSGGIG